MQMENFKECIKAKYRSEAAMAEAMNWPRQRLNKITTGKKEPDVGEIDAMAKALDMSISKVAQFFLP